MLPIAFQPHAALVFIVGGILACFAGYRLFRVVLGIYGFILGALIATSFYGPADTLTTIVVAGGGGLVGALILIFTYFVGVALIGAGLGALVVHLIWSRLATEPHLIVLLIFAGVGAIGALMLQRLVIITGTSLVGSWTAILGAGALLGERVTEGADAREIWIAYPLSPEPGQRWLFIAWLVVAAAGMVVQLATTGEGRRRRRTFR
jgi:hypothetical protein